MTGLNDQKPEPRDYRADGAVEIVGDPWLTVQGEGPFAGRPAAFVRLAGCNLQCPDCFGVGVKSRIPYLSRSVGPKVRLDEVREGEKVLTFDADMNLTETAVKTVLRRTVKRWLKIRINDKTYDVTREHPFFTNRGMVLACDLKIGDQILEARPEEIISYKKMGDRNPMTRPEVAARKAANTNYEQMGERVAATIAGKKAAGTYRTTWETLTPKQRRRVRRKQSRAKLGDKNPNWNGADPNLKRMQRMIKEGQIVTCQKCAKQKPRLLVHHRDEDRTNDAPENLVVWCHRCHNRHHERGYNFWNGNRADGKELIHAHNGQEVQKIEKCKGKLPVVNISCAPYNTYLANGMWVHNCDTDYTADRKYVSAAALTVQVVDLFTSKADPPGADGRRNWWPIVSGPPLVVITGGEPFRQDIGRLVRDLKHWGFDVQVETNGTLPPPPEFPLAAGVVIVCSPKGRVHDDLKPHVGHLKYVIEAGRQHPGTRLGLNVLGNPMQAEQPWPGFRGTVWVQPADLENVECMRLNTEACVDAALTRGYRVCVQIHKILGVK
jgi:organic radical activating enzyme/DNA-directed RNA polymerase subunit M/transcription elongation factor TFIIS